MMRYLRKFSFSIAIMMASIVLMTSCESLTEINTIPSGAKVYVNGEYIGDTPVKYRDTKLSWACTPLKITMDGYQDKNESLCKNEEINKEALFVGLFVWPCLVWIMGYKKSRTYELVPMDEESGE